MTTHDNTVVKDRNNPKTKLFKIKNTILSFSDNAQHTQTNNNILGRGEYTYKIILGQYVLSLMIIVICYTECSILCVSMLVSAKRFRF